MSESRVVSADELERLVLRGAVPLQEVNELLSGACRAAESAHGVVVDLTEAEHLHAACIQVLLALRIDVESKQRTFRLQGISDAARRALTLAGLTQWLTEGEA
jgi:anti-anti-sigma regulatory factor